MSEGKKTKLITAGRNKKWTNGVVNPPCNGLQPSYLIR